METIMEHVAKSIAKDSTDNRLMNMYTQGSVSSLWLYIVHLETTLKLVNLMYQTCVQALHDYIL